LAGQPALSSTQTLSAIYNSNNASGFHDITQGSSTGAYYVYDSFGNFLGTITVRPGPGYDMVTGQGSPAANVLVSDLVNVSAMAAVRTAAVAPTTSSGASGSGKSGRSGAMDLPSGNGPNSAATNAPNNLTMQGLIGPSTEINGVVPASASVVQTANVGLSA